MRKSLVPESKLHNILYGIPIKELIIMNNRASALLFASLSFLICALPLSLNAQQDNDFLYEQSYSEARQFYLAGELDDARTSLLRAQKIANEFPSDDPRLALNLSFQAVVEADRERIVKAKELHRDALTLISGIYEKDHRQTQLIRIRQAEFLLKQKENSRAEELFNEVLSLEEAKEAPNVDYLARSKWGLAQLRFAARDWKMAGRFGMFARQDLQRLYGRDSYEQATTLPMLAECAIRLNQFSYARAWLDEIRAIIDLNPQTSEVLDYNRLDALYNAQVAEFETQQRIAARQRIGVMINKATQRQGLFQPYLPSTAERKTMEETFTLQEMDAPGGLKVKVGTHSLEDAAFSIFEEASGAISKAALGISLDSVNHRKDALHPALTTIVEIFYDPNHQKVLDWMNEVSFMDDGSLQYRNEFTQDNRKIVITRDSVNNLLLYEFYLASTGP